LSMPVKPPPPSFHVPDAPKSGTAVPGTMVGSHAGVHVFSVTHVVIVDKDEQFALLADCQSSRRHVSPKSTIDAPLSAPEVTIAAVRTPRTDEEVEDMKRALGWNKDMGAQQQAEVDKVIEEFKRGTLPSDAPPGYGSERAVFGDLCFEFMSTYSPAEVPAVELRGKE